MEMARHTASWRYPTEKELQQSAGAAERLEPISVRELSAHRYRFECDCPRVIEVQVADAVRLCGPDAALADVAERVKPRECVHSLIRLLRD